MYKKHQNAAKKRQNAAKKRQDAENKRFQRQEQYLSKLTKKPTQFFSNNPIKKSGQFFQFQSIRVSVPSPSDIKLWTTKRTFSENITDRLSPYVAVESKTKTNDSKFAPGSYQHVQGLWDPVNPKLVHNGKLDFIARGKNQLKTRIRDRRVQNARTLNYKTLQPEAGGLFCQKIFGPLTQTEGRRHQLGYLNLAVPSMHVWYLKSTPSPIATILDQKKRRLEKLTYHTGQCSRNWHESEPRYSVANFAGLIRNRHKNLHFSNENKFWLNHSISFNALNHSVFDSFMQTHGLSNIFQLNRTLTTTVDRTLINRVGKKFKVDPSKYRSDGVRAWHKRTTKETMGGLMSLDYIFLSKPWVSFLAADTQWRVVTEQTKTWQQHVVLDTKHLYEFNLDFSSNNKTSLHEITELLSPKPLVMEKGKLKIQKFEINYKSKSQPFIALFELKRLNHLVLITQVFNTVHSLLDDPDIEKSVVMLNNCSLKGKAFVQKQVDSNYSPALKAFFNHLWKTNSLRPSTDSFHTRSFMPLAQPSSNHWITEPLLTRQKGRLLAQRQGPPPPKGAGDKQTSKSSFELSFPYKKEVLRSTFKQKLNDSENYQVETEKQFFIQIQLIMHSQFFNWHHEQKKLSLLTRCIIKMDRRFFTRRSTSSGLGFFQTSCFDRYALESNHSEHISLGWDYDQKTIDKAEFLSYTFVAMSLFTRLLEITAQGKVTKIFLLPFFNEYSHITRQTVNRTWYRTRKQLRVRLSQTLTKKRLNPLGTATFRHFLTRFFQRSIKKNYLASLIKKSKSLLISSQLHQSVQHDSINQFANHFKTDNKKVCLLNQIDYEKHKCVYGFLNQLILMDDLNLNLLNKTPPLRRKRAGRRAGPLGGGNRQNTRKRKTTQKTKRGKKIAVQRKKTLNRVKSFVSQQNQILGRIGNLTANQKPFSKCSYFFKTLNQHPFCYHFLTKTFKRKKTLTLLNPFYVQEKAFLVRYLQTERSSASFQHYYSFIINYYNFKNKHDKKKEKSKKLYESKWRKIKTINNKDFCPSNFFPYLKFQFFQKYGSKMVASEINRQRYQTIGQFFDQQPGAHRNTFAVVPTLFVWRTGRRIDEEWTYFHDYIVTDLPHQAIIIPSYVERLVYDCPKTQGAEVIESALRNFFENQQSFLNSLPETETNKQRRQVNEPFIFSNDNKPFLHERLLLGPQRTQKPMYYQLSYGIGHAAFVTWLQNEIQQADPIVYKCEKLLKGRHASQKKQALANVSKWELARIYRSKDKFRVPPTPLPPYNIADVHKKAPFLYLHPFFYIRLHKQLVHNRLRRFKMIRMLKAISPFLRPPMLDPSWMVLRTLPVLPPDLRPILVLGSQQMIVSDLNKLYQQIIYRNTRLYKAQQTQSRYNRKFNRYSERLLQEAVDALINNGRGNAPATLSSSEQPLKSLSEMLKGKKGRFRQNLLGKRVDYSGRSVIVVGPQLKIYECGLPKEMALELFKPFLIRYLVNHGFTRHLFSAKKLIQSKNPIIWYCLRKVMVDRPLLLNRAPTLHRLGMQAFRPKLVSGRAILLHPLVCSAFNADFDGDQMAVHIPLSPKACSEAWKLMWSRNNILSPATGDPTITPSQDMILGCYYLTTMDTIHRFKQLQQNRDLRSKTLSQVTNAFPFQSIDQVLHLVQMQKLQYHSVIWLKWSGSFELEQKKQRCIEIQLDASGHLIKIYPDYKIYDHVNYKKPLVFIKTTPGRALINQSVFDVLSK